MIKSYIFGTSSLAKLLAYYLSEDGKKIDGFVLNESFVKDSDRYKYYLPLFTIEEVIKEYGCKNIEVFVAIGYSHMNKDREKIFDWLRDNNIKICSYIHPSAIVAKNAILGEGNIILENCVIQPFVTIGDGNIFWNNSTISHESLMGSYNYIAPGVTIAGRVIIKDKCFFGVNSTLRNDIFIGSDVLIAAGSYANCSLNDGTVLFPAKGTIVSDQSSLIGNLL